MRKKVRALMLAGSLGAGVLATACQPEPPVSVEWACGWGRPHAEDVVLGYPQSSWDKTVYRCTARHGSSSTLHKYCVFPPGSPPDDSWASGGC